MRPKTSSITLEEASDLLRRVGVRRTIARVNLLRCLADLDAPQTQAQISERLAPHGFDGSTVFRGLTDLTEAGLVVRIDAGDRIWRFELRDRDPMGVLDPNHHPHVVCIHCGRLACLSHAVADVNPGAAEGWTIHGLVLRGTCPVCHGSKGQ